MARLKTFMSPVCSRTPAEGGATTNSVQVMPVLSERWKQDGASEGPLYWLDEMLGGGLEIPGGGELTEPSFLLLLAGPPGTGKSTFGLELCYNLARFPQDDPLGNLNCLYVSSEHSAARVIGAADSFGWSINHFVTYERYVEEDWRPADHVNGYCVVLGQETLPQFTDEPLEFFDALSRSWDAIGDLDRIAPVEGLRPQLPNVVVIDSLNVLRTGSDDDPHRVCDQVRKLRTKIAAGRGRRPLLLVLVVDGFTGSGANADWEFLADAVFRFDSHIGAEDGYYQRTFQIMKIKTQGHALGKHGFKILAPDKRAEPSREPVALQGMTDSPAGRPTWPTRTRGTPYLPSGGAFIFPTVHWHLSQSIPDTDRDETPADAGYLPTPLPEFNLLLGGQDSGFPAAQTTALIGQRGGMKSHLAYHFLLNHLVAVPAGRRPKKALLVSLRDDVKSTRGILATILRQQRMQGLTPDNEKDSRDVVQRLMNEDSLEVIHNWPGCISPGEFFHRIFVALRRQRAGGGTAEIVVLNGLDHLEAQFPLCAQERTFIPALLSLFRCNRVCSVIISTDEGRGTASYEIGPMADLILDFSETRGDDLNATPNAQQAVQRSKVTVVRIPAGKIGGQWGVLARNKDGQVNFFRPAR